MWEILQRNRPVELEAGFTVLKKDSRIREVSRCMSPRAIIVGKQNKGQIGPNSKRVNGNAVPLLAYDSKSSRAGLNHVP